MFAGINIRGNHMTAETANFSSKFHQNYIKYGDLKVNVPTGISQILNLWQSYFYLIYISCYLQIFDMFCVTWSFKHNNIFCLGGDIIIWLIHEWTKFELEFCYVFWRNLIFIFVPPPWWSHSGGHRNAGRPSVCPSLQISCTNSHNIWPCDAYHHSLEWVQRWMTLTYLDILF